MTETDWKSIALALAQRINFAVVHLKGDGGLMNIHDGTFQGWREYFAEGIEQIPGVKVDREMLAAYGLPPAKRKKEIAMLKARKE